MRRKTRQIHVGDVLIGGDAPVAVQSMTTMYTRDVDASVAQINRLEEVGCEIVRVAVPEEEDALATRRDQEAHLNSARRRHPLRSEARPHRHRAGRRLDPHQSRQPAAWA